jgi:hypothetical protein
LYSNSKGIRLTVFLTASTRFGPSGVQSTIKIIASSFSVSEHNTLFLLSERKFGCNLASGCYVKNHFHEGWWLFKSLWSFLKEDLYSGLSVATVVYLMIFRNCKKGEK